MEDEVTETNDSISFPKGKPYCSLLNDLHYGTRRKRSTGLPSSCIGWVLSVYTFLVIIFVLVGATHGLGYLGSKAFKDRLDAGEIAVLVANILFFVYVEGYLGFYRSWAPVTANRCMLAGSLLCREQPIQSGFLILLSPLFALGYFWASKRRLVISYMLIVMIFLLAIGVRSLPQPWHAIAGNKVFNVSTRYMISMLTYLQTVVLQPV
mmetsp:Transcript_1957/g.2799  ORF Transcript_1957/g.2799 Transcript_1957/m.2799 type:complete len:208 (-) Transcript_1957:1119-1742(-)